MIPTKNAPTVQKTLRNLAPLQGEKLNKTLHPAGYPVPKPVQNRTERKEPRRGETIGGVIYRSDDKLMKKARKLK